jgi:hypothetical protein
MSTLPKIWIKKGWIDICSDFLWEAYGGLWGKEVKPGNWLFVRFENMIDAMGERDVKQCCGEFLAEVLEVDLKQLPEKELRSALDCIGAFDSGKSKTLSEIPDIERAYACVSYGNFAVLDSYEGNHYPNRIRKKAFVSAETLAKDAKLHAKKLQKPYNAIGTTNADMLRGDLLAGLRKYVDSGDIGMKPDPKKDLMLKIYGYPKKN